MLWTHRRASWALCLVLIIIPIACASEAGDSDANLAVFEQALTEAKTALETKRAELSGAKDQIANAAEDVTEEAMAALVAQRDALVEEATALSDEVGSKATELINSAGLLVGEEPEGVVRDAMLTKQHEDMLVAQEYIDKAGDYARAIQIMEQVAAALPIDNPELNAALEDAKAKQYMDQERFALVRNGMSPEEVRSILGTVNPHNRKEYADRNVEAWFYRREEGIAGVYFETRRGELRVYKTDFDVQTGS